MDKLRRIEAGEHIEAGALVAVGGAVGGGKAYNALRKCWMANELCAGETTQQVIASLAPHVEFLCEFHNQLLGVPLPPSE